MALNYNLTSALLMLPLLVMEYYYNDYTKSYLNLIHSFIKPNINIKKMEMTSNLNYIEVKRFYTKNTLKFRGTKPN